MVTWGRSCRLVPAVSDQIINDTETYGYYDLFQHAGDIAYAGIGGPLSLKKFGTSMETKSNPLLRIHPT